ncbi:RING-variant domain-containing protein [Ditylenchus destructor]|uniref:RING-variant domain-containing protein n=1 Tax=Ditylenchus destructor TaxID=166010 RepID=A0AAD4R6A9_9BILA|nr:RING-variant domain-containing protein [Ditylenchus destructor]
MTTPIHHQTSYMIVCRICYSGENSSLSKYGEPLISPCNCRGSVGLYHYSCLKKWLHASGKTVCEICQFPFNVKKTKPSVWSYLNDNSALERKLLCTDILYFAVVTFLAFLSAAVCVSLAMDFMYDYKNQGFSEPRTDISTGLVVLTFILLFAYSVWMVITISSHRKSFRNWRNSHVDVEITDRLNQNDSTLMSTRTTGYNYFL